MRKKMKNKLILNIAIFVGVISLLGCRGDSSPGYEYMPNMYRSPSYETYSENSLFDNNSTARLPVTGTIARGFMPFEYENTLQDYLRAGRELKNPIEMSDRNLEVGEQL